MRIALGYTLRNRVPVRCLLEEAKQLSVNQLAAQSVLMTAWKAIQRGRDDPLTNLFTRNTVVLSQIQTGLVTNGELKLEGNTSQSQKNFRFVAGRLWNMAPQQFQNTVVIIQAKNIIRQFVSTLPIV